VTSRIGPWALELKALTFPFERPFDARLLFSLVTELSQMKLKDIKHRGRFVLPPVWNKTRDTAPAVIGEVGVLRFVYAHPEVSSKCYIVMDQSEKYIGELVFDDKLTAHRAVQLLRANIGAEHQGYRRHRTCMGHHPEG
jgi:hypothetical protein